METSNIIALILGGLGFIISIINLVLTPILNLKSKKLEKRLEYRFMLFSEILELWEFTHKKENQNNNEYSAGENSDNKLSVDFFPLFS